MDALILSTSVVALAEMGDKTQLLSLLLAARFRRPWTIVLGILIATVLNHAMAGALGAWLTSWVSGNTLRWILGACFLAMAVWLLIPDQLDEEEVDTQTSRWGVLGTTIVVFFLAEMGDKTQVATVMLGAQYASSYTWVVAGTTLGMMLANAPAVWLGERVVKWVPMHIVHRVAAAIFAVLGVLTIGSIWWSSAH